jgi:hypothetical protein
MDPSLRRIVAEPQLVDLVSHSGISGLVVARDFGDIRLLYKACLAKSA